MLLSGSDEVGAIRRRGRLVVVRPPICKAGHDEPEKCPAARRQEPANVIGNGKDRDRIGEGSREASALEVGEVQFVDIQAIEGEGDLALCDGGRPQGIRRTGPSCWLNSESGEDCELRRAKRVEVSQVALDLPISGSIDGGCLR